MNLKCGFDDGDDLSRIAYNLELMPITLNYFEYPVISHQCPLLMHT